MNEISNTLPILQRAIAEGFRHVLPLGLDHVLFMISLSLMTQALSRRIVLCSFFTLAHSCSLALGVNGLVYLPPAIVEPAIALSILVVALMNYLRDTRQEKSKRWWTDALLVFCFGLVHGLGFASALSDSGLNHSEIVPSLLGFNAGVETAQLLIVLAISALVALWTAYQRRERYVLYLHQATALVALFWCVERIVLLWA